MTSPLIATMPTYAWLMLLFTCVVIAGIGAIVIRGLRTGIPETRKWKHRIPSCVLAFVAGLILGLLIAVAEGLAHRTEEFPQGQCDYFTGIIVYSTFAGLIVTIVLAIVVDLPSFLNRRNSSNDAGT